MKPSPQNVRPLEYARPHTMMRRSPVRPFILAILTVSIAVIAGGDAYKEVRHRSQTNEYSQHVLEENWRSRWDPSYVAKPFVGRRYVYESPFEVKSIYVFAVASFVGWLAIRNAARRQRGL